MKHLFIQFTVFAAAALLSLPGLQAQDTSSLEEALLEEARDDEALKATLFPIPAYAGDLWTRAAMTGDWGGVRTAVAKDGFQFEIDAVNFVQGVTGGGLAHDWRYSGSADYRIRLDTDQAGLWPGGFIEIHGDTFWGRDVNGITGALLPVNVDAALSAPAGVGTYLSHVIVTQFLSEKVAVVFGKLDTTAGDTNRFAHGVGDRRFMNLGFSFNPTLLLVSPYSTLGAGIIIIPRPGVTLSFTAMDSDGQIDRAGFDTVFNGAYTYGTELAVDTAFFDQPGRHTFGGLYSTKNFSGLSDPRLDVPTGAIIPKLESNSWAFYYNFDQHLVSDPDDPSRGWGIFGRFGAADSATNLIQTFYSAGIGGNGVIPGREDDRFGIGYYYLKTSDDRVGLLTDDDEHGFEVFYNFRPTPWLELTANFQAIDGAVRFGDTATVVGFRGRILF